MNPRFSLILFFSFTLGISCSSLAQKENNKGNLPKWVEKPSSLYNSDTYLLAVGTGSSLDEAQNHAFEKLSRIFQSKIRTNQKMIDEFRETSIDDKIKSDRIIQLLSVTEIGSRQNLINAKILKTYSDKTGNYYALAGLKRKETARLYTAEIRRNNVLLHNYQKNINSENSQLRRLALIKKALILARVNENLKKQRDILLNQSTNNSGNKVREQLVKDYRNLRKRSFIYLDATQLPSNLQSSVIRVFEEEGFRVTAHSDKAIMKARIVYTYHEVNLKRKDAHFINWLFSMQMIDTRTGVKLKTFSLKGRDGGLSKQGAIVRSQHTLQNEIHKQLKSFLEEELLKIN
ncbi:MAG TPA: LPP20 family lipoprotein [Balneolales bacterium]|nr:LPP20 family lipoprotein [Balneolales bacterium]